MLPKGPDKLNPSTKPRPYESKVLHGTLGPLGDGWSSSV